MNIAFSQVGIKTDNPEATIDVRAKNHLGAVDSKDGVLVPRVNSLINPGSVNGQLVYLIEDTTSPIFNKGFHYWDGSIWQPFAGSGDPTKDSWIDNASNTRIELGTLSDGVTARPSGSEFVALDNGNVGIGNSNPTARVEISSGTSNVSGLKFSNINNSTPSTNNAAALGVDAAGNVVVQNSLPLQTKFVSFSVDANTPANSTVQIGTLEFRIQPGQCVSGTAPYTLIQARSISGESNIGIVQGSFMTSQLASQNSFQVSMPSTIGTSFAQVVGAAGLDCYNDGHSQFIFFSYTDRTFYRVNFHVADGDELGFGSQGYIFVEYQK